jgi:hypothetical protein
LIDEAPPVKRRQFHIRSLMFLIAYIAAFSPLFVQPKIIEHPTSVAAILFTMGMIETLRSATRITDGNVRHKFAATRTLTSLVQSSTIAFMIYLSLFQQGMSEKPIRFGIAYGLCGLTIMTFATLSSSVQFPDGPTRRAYVVKHSINNFYRSTLFVLYFVGLLMYGRLDWMFAIIVGAILPDVLHWRISHQVPPSESRDRFLNTLDHFLLFLDEKAADPSTAAQIRPVG